MMNAQKFVFFNSVLYLSIFQSFSGFSDTQSHNFPFLESELIEVHAPCEEKSAVDVADISLPNPSNLIEESSSTPLAVPSAPLAEENQSMPSVTPSDLLVEENPKKTITPVLGSCRPDIQPYQVNIRHSEWEGIGYKEGYSTLEGFFAPSIGSYIPFLDLRAHVFNDGRFAGNVGIGTRYVIQPNKWMAGANFYYDYRKTKHSHFNQIGLGLEGFMDRWEFRANGYLPVGSKTHLYDKKLEGISFEGFQGHYLLIYENYSQKREAAMKGFNAEVGVHPLQIMRNYDLFLGIGPYYFHGKGNSTAWGGKVRAKAEITKYVFLEVSDSYDRVFHNRFQAQLTVSIPFGGRKLRSSRKQTGNTPASCFADNVMYWRGSQPVERQEIIVVHKDTKYTKVDPVAINAATGQPFYFVFVNNANPNLGDGTFENPFSHLSTGTNNAQDASVPGNIIYVFSGDGTTNNMRSGITLKDSQRFLGSGVTHQFTTTKGVLVVPALTSNLPSLDNAMGATVVTLASAPSSNQEVSGFNITTLTTAACIGGGDLKDASINRNKISGFTGIFCGLADPGVSSNFFIDSNQIMGNGIEISMGGASFLSVTNNTIFNSGSSGLYAHTGGGTTATILVSGNEIHQLTLGNGITLESGSGVSSLDIKIFNNNIHHVTGMGSNNGHGIQIQTVSTGHIRADVENNLLSNNQSTGLLFDITAGSSGCLRLVNNIAYLNAGGDYQISTAGGAPLNLEPPDNNVGVISLSSGITFVPPCTCLGCP